MSESPRPTEAEQEHTPERLEDEEEMRGPNQNDPELPADDRGDDDHGGDDGDA